MPPLIRRALLFACVLAGAGAMPVLAVASAGPPSVIVKFRPGRVSAKRAEQVHRSGVGKTIGSVRGLGARVVSVTGDPGAVSARLNRLPGVLYAEPNERLRALGAPSDPMFSQQGDLTRIDALAGWDALGLSDYPGSGGVPVGIVDTGIDATHEDLAGKVAACGSSVDGKIVSGCADDNGHGTHTSGTIAANANNGVGIAGVAFSSRLIVCRALGGADGSGTLADVASCIGWVHDRGAKVISMSLGGSASITMRNAVRAAWKNGGSGGSVLVAAAGNDSDSSTEYPAGYDEVVSVGAVDDGGNHASFSNTNPDVEIAAPGVNVLSTKLGGGYIRYSGTSMATPHVAGAVALLWGRHRRSRASAIRAELDGLVADAGAPGRDPVYGFGVLDLGVLGAVE
jgi:thermitase